ncbi:MAG: hypothetical protein JXA64_10345 [Candidatus Fermentibacteraceae bacterium]|nr:hypothetical protein [Candidatus Fermentibacteraceae bacterium]MBN2609501.1 hypothetical protein [Candidatus Fermentibacteraceae bacterium]
MEYFTQDDGRYVSKGVPGMSGGSGALRIAVSILPMVVLAGIILNSSGRSLEMNPALPLIVMGSVFGLSSLLAAVLKSRGRGSGVVVDQMKGTVTYRKPGGQRHTVQLSAVKEIGLQISGADMYTGSEKKNDTGALIYLMTPDDRRIPLAYSRKGRELRQFADELSILTSLPVLEHIGGR